MQVIKKKEDIVIVSKGYFDGMTKKLENLVNIVGIHNFESMDEVLYLRKWLDASMVDREMKKLNPNVCWDNIHLLLSQQSDCGGQCNPKKDSKLPRRHSHKKGCRK